MEKLDIVVILHNIRSVYNVASIFRTADAAGVGKIYPHTKRSVAAEPHKNRALRSGVGVYLCGITPGPLDRFGNVLPQFAKVSLGAEKSVEWEIVRSPKAVRVLIDKLSAKGGSAFGGKKSGHEIFAVEQAKSSIPYYLIHSTNLRSKVSRVGTSLKVALIFGNEVRGLPASILKKSDKILEIPMQGAIVRQGVRLRLTRSPHYPRLSGRGKESLNVSVAFGIVIYSLLYK